MAFQKATKDAAKLRMSISGGPGFGKTRSALEIARHFGKIALADTEYKSASKYAGVNGLDFEVQTVPEPYNPAKVGQLIKEAADASFDILILDSLTHFWNGTGGFLELVDAEARKAAARGGKHDTFSAWKVVDPQFRKMVDQILCAPIHVIVTMRSKIEHAIEEQDGRKKVRKLGMAPEMRDNFGYAMDIEGAMTQDHKFVVGKTRIDETDGQVYDKPGKDLAEILKNWLLVAK
jgi:hypothetical protein